MLWGPSQLGCGIVCCFQPRVRTMLHFGGDLFGRFLLLLHIDHKSKFLYQKGLRRLVSLLFVEWSSWDHLGLQVDKGLGLIFLSYLLGNRIGLLVSKIGGRVGRFD